MFDIITIGTAVRDSFIKSKEFRVLEDDSFTAGKALALPLGAKIDVDDMTLSYGGVGVNAAITFARQGHSVACLARIGDDVEGKAVTADMKAEGIDTNILSIKTGKKTGSSVLLLSTEGARTVLTSRGASASFSWAEDVDEAKINAKWFYLGGSLPIEFVEHALDFAKRIGAKVAFAPSKVHIKLGLNKLGEVLKKANVVTLNREEAAQLTAIDYKKEKEIFTLLDNYVDGIIVMTEGAKGVLVSNGKSIYSAGIFREKEKVDRTGAGDAFGSGFVAGLINIDDLSTIGDEEIKLAIRLASANSTSVVENMGANAGVLKKEDFKNDNRWQNLDIKISSV